MLKSNIAHESCEMIWIKTLLRELKHTTLQLMVMHYDNQITTVQAAKFFMHTLNIPKLIIISSNMFKEISISYTTSKECFIQPISGIDSPFCATTNA